jgi:hypothetical protein
LFVASYTPELVKISAKTLVVALRASENGSRNQAMNMLGIIALIAVIGIVIALWRIKRPPPPPPVS